MPTKLLIIDDDFLLSETLKTALESEAFEVFVANTGPAGIEAAREWAPDVILLDLMMPDMDGWQVCRAIREFSQTPVLVLSAVINPTMVARALDEGANDYLVKPAPTGVLASRLNRLARYARANRQESSGSHP